MTDWKNDMSIRGSITLERSERVPIRRRGTLRARNKFAVDVAIEDLSETGCMFRSEFPLPVGTLITVGISGIAMHAARISRVSGVAHGCAFLVPIRTEDIATARVVNTVADGDFKQMREEVYDAGRTLPNREVIDDLPPRSILSRLLARFLPRRN